MTTPLTEALDRMRAAKARPGDYELLRDALERRERVDPDLLARIEALRWTAKPDDDELLDGWHKHNDAIDDVLAILAPTEAPQIEGHYPGCSGVEGECACAGRTVKPATPDTGQVDPDRDCGKEEGPEHQHGYWCEPASDAVRERVDPDLRAQATALREIILELHRIRGRMTKVTVADFAAAILAATEAPREPETCHECGEPVDGHEHDGYGRRLERAATPDHTVVGEEQEAEIAAIADVLPDAISAGGGTVQLSGPYRGLLAKRLHSEGLRATPRPR
jgi:hypothetical protein